MLDPFLFFFSFFVGNDVSNINIVIIRILRPSKGVRKKKKKKIFHYLPQIFISDCASTLTYTKILYLNLTYEIDEIDAVPRPTFHYYCLNNFI